MAPPLMAAEDKKLLKDALNCVYKALRDKGGRVDMWVNAHKHEFDDAEEHDLMWTKRHEEFSEIMEAELEAFCSERSMSTIELYETLADMKEGKDTTACVRPSVVVAPAVGPATTLSETRCQPAAIAGARCEWDAWRACTMERGAAGPRSSCCICWPAHAITRNSSRCVSKLHPRPSVPPR